VLPETRICQRVQGTGANWVVRASRTEKGLSVVDGPGRIAQPPGSGRFLRPVTRARYIEIDETLSEEEAKAKVHENCLVLRITYEGGTSVMLTGDSNLACWQRIVDYYDDDDDEATGTEVLSADVLSGSHHGSRTFYKPGDEDSKPWLAGLETIAPDLVVVSVGADNDHGHPHADMMGAYRDQCDTENVHETAQSGTVLVEVDSGGDYVLALDPGNYAEDYAWDDEDDGDDDRGGAAKGALAGVAVAGGAALVAAGVKRHRDRRSRTRLDNQPAA
jgi:hypothetical protein